MKTVPEMYLGCDGASQNPHPSDADVDLSRDQNYQLFIATAIQFSYLKLNSYKQTSSEYLKSL